MKKNFIAITALAFVTFMILSFKSPDKINIWMIGDSTMANKSAKAAPETGWGMVFNEFVNENVTVHNHAVNGRSSKSFLNEGHWKAVYDSIQPGDYVIIEFGHNDEKPAEKLHTDAATTYKELLKKYIDETRAKGANPIICSSIVRRQFDGEGNLKDTHGDYIKASREIALETKAPFIDMEALTRKVVAELGPEKSKSLYLFTKPGEYPNRKNGVADSTHLNGVGARKFAGLFVEEVKKQKLPLKGLFK
ncbi:MAG: rhamnogalacturonan acetylesterase [Paludibacter sp.]|nr:rhamnogalacturonan acetylesterase [Paludibacter sp.]